MDIAAVVGLIGACALIVMAMGDPGPFVDTASVLIVFGGSIMATLYRSTLPEFIGFTKVMGKTFGGYPDKPEDLIVQLAELATIARKDGMIALEGQEIKNKFLAKEKAMKFQKGKIEAVANEYQIALQQQHETLHRFYQQH